MVSSTVPRVTNPFVIPSSAARAFGKFQGSFLTELHSEIISHLKQEASGLVPQPVQGITVQGSEVLEPDIPRPGGLMRSDTVW